MTASQLFRSRGFGPNGTTRSLGKPAAAFPARIAADADLAIAVDRQQTRLAVPLDASSNSMTVSDASMIVASNLLSIDSEIVQVTGPPTGNVVPISRGFDGTTPAVHLASAVVSGFIDAYHHNRLVAEVEAIESALGPNLGNLAASAFLNSDTFNYPPVTPGGTLAPGANTITMTPPPGVTVGGTAYISGGTGAAEAVPVIGAGASSVIVTCANAHSGSWTIRSATSGIQEAILAAAGKQRVRVPYGV